MSLDVELGLKQKIQEKICSVCGADLMDACDVVQMRNECLWKDVLGLLDGYICVEKKELDSNLLERLAKLEHEQWSHWIQYQKTQKELAWLDFFNKTRKPQFDSNNMERWIVQSQTPYSKLTEKEKESDRELARNVLASIKLTHICVEREKLQKLPDERKIKQWLVNTEDLPLILRVQAILGLYQKELSEKELKP